MKKYHMVDEYINDLEPWMQKRFSLVRNIILTFPGIKEKVRFNAPFYDYRGMMLYMGIYQKKRLMLGFCDGHMMPDEAGILIADAGQTQIRHLELFSDKAPDEELLVEYIQQAMQLKELKKPKYVARKTGR